MELESLETPVESPLNGNKRQVDSHESSSIKVLGVSDGPKINIAISTNL